jgi:hypothetical protein
MHTHMHMDMDMTHSPDTGGTCTCGGETERGAARVVYVAFQHFFHLRTFTAHRLQVRLHSIRSHTDHTVSRTTE